MCAQAGVKFTPAGATFPHSIDPEDRNIRIAPSYAEEGDIWQATKLLTLCTRITALEKLLQNKFPERLERQ